MAINAEIRRMNYIAMTGDQSAVRAQLGEK